METIIEEVKEVLNLNESPVENVDELESIQETPVETAKETAPTEVVSDEYVTCPDCKGHALINNDTAYCPVCEGTGKVHATL